MTETFNEGDLIEATKGEQVIRGRVIIEADHGGPLRLDNMPWSMPTLDTLRSHGFTLTLIEKAAPALPTEVGAVVRIGNEGDRWHWLFWLSKKGDWDCIDFRGHSYTVADPITWIREQDETIGSITRMEPVADTARKVIDYIAATWDFGTPPGVTAALDDARKEFGVTS